MYNIYFVETFILNFTLCFFNFKFVADGIKFLVVNIVTYDDLILDSLF